MRLELPLTETSNLTSDLNLHNYIDDNCSYQFENTIKGGMEGG